MVLEDRIFPILCLSTIYLLCEIVSTMDLSKLSSWARKDVSSTFWLLWTPMLRSTVPVSDPSTSRNSRPPRSHDLLPVAMDFGNVNLKSSLWQRWSYPGIRILTPLLFLNFRATRSTPEDGTSLPAPYFLRVEPHRSSIHHRLLWNVSSPLFS